MLLRLVGCSNVCVLMLRIVRLGDVDHVDFAGEQPVDGKSELGRFSFRETEGVAPPVARLFRLVGHDQNVLDIADAHDEISPDRLRVAE